MVYHSTLLHPEESTDICHLVASVVCGNSAILLFIFVSASMVYY